MPTNKLARQPATWQSTAVSSRAAVQGLSFQRSQEGWGWNIQCIAAFTLENTCNKLNLFVV